MVVVEGGGGGEVPIHYQYVYSNYCKTIDYQKAKNRFDTKNE